MDEWLSVYASMLKRIIDRNKNYLETKNVRLHDAIRHYLETWAAIDSIVSKTDKNGDTVMSFAVYHLWFPSGTFSFIYNVLSSDIGGTLRTLRFALEALEIGIIGDCCPDLGFHEKILDKKVEILSEMRPADILKNLETIVDDKMLKRLRNIYTRLSQLAHPTLYGEKLIRLFQKNRDIPSIALYYPDLDEFESEIIEDLIKLIDEFCDIAKKLIEIWKKCLTFRNFV